MDYNEAKALLDAKRAERQVEADAKKAAVEARAATRRSESNQKRNRRSSPD